MTVEQVRTLVHEHSIANRESVNDHRITLEQAIVDPQRVTLIARQICYVRVTDEKINAWLIGQEDEVDGYKIILSEDGCKFGLASSGFPGDQHLILVGWYGTLVAAFMGM